MWPHPPLSAAYMLAAALAIGGAACAAASLGYAYQHYRQPSLRHWMFGLAAEGLALVLLLLTPPGDAASPATLAPAMVRALVLPLDLVAAASMLLGAYEFAGKGPVRTSGMVAGAALSVGIAALVVLAALTGTAAASGSPRGRLPLLLSALASAAAGALLLGGAYLVGRSPAIGRSVGWYGASACLAVAGIERLAGIGMGSPLRVARAALPADLSYADVLLQLLFAGSVLLALLTEEWATPGASAALDTVTDLPRRRHFRKHIERALADARARGDRMAVFFLDLDRFKQINDTFGHAAGDAVLRAVAQRIRSVLTEGQTLSRAGGDEFTILVPRTIGPDEALALARNVRDAVIQPVSVQGREIAISTSVGIALFPDHADTVDELLHCADVALYSAKHRGRDTFVLYTPGGSDRPRRPDVQS